MLSVWVVAGVDFVVGCSRRRYWRLDEGEEDDEIGWGTGEGVGGDEIILRRR